MNSRPMRTRLRAAVAPWWAACRAVHQFAVTGAIGLLVLEALLILGVWGMIGGGYGVSSVVWVEPPENTSGLHYFSQPLVWNGAAVATYFWISAYLIYLLFASVPDERQETHALWDWPRVRVYVAKAVPPIFLAILPALLAILPAFGPDRPEETSWSWRWGFVVGIVVASILFNLAVWVLTNVRSGRGEAAAGAASATPLQVLWATYLARQPVGWFVREVRRRFRADRTEGEAQVQLQADALFGGVLLVYSGLVGYTLSAGSDAAWWPAYPFGAAVVAFWVWFIARTPWPGDRMLPGRWLGVATVLLASGAVVGFVWMRADGERTWPLLVVVFGVLLTASPALVALYRLRRAYPDRVPFDSAQVAGSQPGPNVLAYCASAAFWACLGAGAGYVVGRHGLDSRHHVLPAAASICFGLAVPAVIYGVLRLYAGRWFYPALAAGLGAVLTAGAVRPYPHHIDELRSHYGSLWDSDVAANKPDLTQYPLMRAGEPQAPGASAAGVAGAWAAAAPERQLDDTETLMAWHRVTRGGAGRDKPPLVIVTTSGGASVSALYTFRILTQLEREIPGFHKYVRFASGASGGMLGAAVWRAWLTDPHGNSAENSTLSGDWTRELEADFLAPIIQALAFKDAPLSALCPQGYADDRGRRLERAWESKFGDHWTTLTFKKMREEERDGRYPSLVFTPMMVEDGRPLYVSTLDLDPIVYTVRDAGPQVRGLEFLKLFPHAGWDLRVGTAARLSASFPYFSPAATLPTAPPRRLVDAGYLDNYGMAVALAWLNFHCVQSAHLDGPAPIDEVLEIPPQAHPKAPEGVAGRVVILELRPYGLWNDAVATPEERDAVGEPRWGKGKKRVPPFVSPFQEVTTPPEGGDSARRAGMLARNEQQFDVIQSYADARGFEINRVVLNGELHSALNWSLPKKEVQEIADVVTEMFTVSPPSATGRRNRREIVKLKAALK